MLALCNHSLVYRVDTNSINPVSQGRLTGQKPCIHAGLSRFDGHSHSTSCPRGHHGRWVDIRTNQTANVDPVALPPEERAHYRWEGPELIYTFWAKHGPCGAHGCDHRTPLFKSLIIAQKTMTTNYLELTCPECGEVFHAELGESRMAPGAELLCADADEPAFSTTSQEFANLLNDYDKGTAQDTDGLRSGGRGNRPADRRKARTGRAGGRRTEPPSCRAHRQSAGSPGGDHRIFRSR